MFKFDFDAQAFSSDLDSIPFDIDLFGYQVQYMYILNKFKKISQLML